MDAGDLAILRVPARLATAARCLLGRLAVMGNILQAGIAHKSTKTSGEVLPLMQGTWPS